jgi:hypothetical protein
MKGSGRGVEWMGRAAYSLEKLRQDLNQTQSVIDILERASQELVTIISYDDAMRSNPRRGDQLMSIGEQLALARHHRISLARQIERLEARA